MTQSKSSSLIQLIEVFPSWPQEDLQAVLNEAGGDVYVAISRISEGHVSQWSDSTKKTTLTSSTFETRPMRSDRNDRSQRSEHSNYSNRNENKTDNARGQRPMREQRDRPQSIGNRTPAPVKSVPTTAKTSATKTNTVTEDLSWGDSPQGGQIERSVASLTSAAVADRSFATPKTSFAEAAASVLTEKPKKESVAIPIHNEASEFTTEVKNETIEPQISETIVVEEVSQSAAEIEVIVSEPEVVPSTEAQMTEPIVAEVEAVEEEEIVFMPARATPSLTMEQPAVVLPVRTNLRSNLTVRFGYDSSEDFVTPATTVASVEKPSIEEAQPTKTPITVSALESTFAMLSASPVPAAKSPEPILSQPAPEVSAWETSRNTGFGAGSSASNVSAGYGNFSRSRQPGGWDYEPTNSASAANPSSNAQGSFGPAPGFSGPSSPAAPQRFVSRAAAQYEHANVYNSSNNPCGNNVNNNARFSPYDETNTAGNNVSQYYTTRTAPQATSGGYPVYRGGNSFNSSRYSSSSRPYYQQHHSPSHPHHQQSPGAQQQSPSTSHYTPYNPHQNYLNNYHHGYPQYGQHADQYAHQQPQQPFYQPYQPPNQYLSNSNMHHHSHHQNQHHNA